MIKKFVLIMMTFFALGALLLGGNISMRNVLNELKDIEFLTPDLTDLQNVLNDWQSGHDFTVYDDTFLDSLSRVVQNVKVVALTIVEVIKLIGTVLYDCVYNIIQVLTLLGGLKPV